MKSGIQPRREDQGTPWGENEGRNPKDQAIWNRRGKKPPGRDFFEKIKHI